MNRLTTLALLLSSVTCAAVVACTTESTNTSTPNPDGGSSSGDNSSGGNGDGGTTGGTVKGGTISLTQTVIAIPTLPDVVSVSGSAFFFEGTTTAGTTTGGEAKCTTTTEGACTVTECDSTGVTTTDAGTTVTDAGPAKKSPNAGEIALKSVRETKMTVNEDGTYKALSENTLLWNDGEDVTVKAVGADVPAFEKALKGIGAITITAPEWPATPGTPIEIDRAADLVLTWEGGTAGQLAVSGITTLDKKSAIMSCSFKSDAGTGTVSKVVLGKLLAGSGVFAISSSNSEIVKAGDWNVTISITGAVKTEAGTTPLPTATYK